MRLRDPAAGLQINVYEIESRIKSKKDGDGNWHENINNQL
jgi:hypothetical protein